jgi:sulfatase maturation enzyme AslB (radical SAM superfamily)
MNLTKTAALVSKRLLPNKARARAIIAYQRTTNWWKYGDPNFPRTIAIEISVFCNRTCHYCPNTSNKTPKIFMSEEMFDLSLQRLVEIKWRGIVDYNFYNEPTADDRLVDFVKKTTRTVPGAVSRIVTNGDYLTRDYMRELIDAGVINFFHQPSLPEQRCVGPQDGEVAR